MKKFLIPVLALGLFAAAPAYAEDDHTPLEDQMSALNDAYKAFRRTEDAAEGAKLARDAQMAVIKGMTMTPSFVEKGGHADGKEKAMAAYRKQMAELLIVLCDVETAFLAEDLEKVKELVTPIRDAKKKGHNEFMEE